MVLRNISGRYPDNKTFINDFSHKGGSVLDFGGKVMESIAGIGEKGSPVVAFFAPELLPEYEAGVKALQYGGEGIRMVGKGLKSVQLD